nr:hypothetical protein [uncultured Albidiferax sp.]
MSAPSSRNLLQRSALAWPAWLRVLAVVPAVTLLWLGVAWANQSITPW